MSELQSRLSINSPASSVFQWQWCGHLSLPRRRSSPTFRWPRIRHRFARQVGHFRASARGGHLNGSRVGGVSESASARSSAKACGRIVSYRAKLERREDGIIIIKASSCRQGFELSISRVCRIRWWWIFFLLIVFFEQIRIIEFIRCGFSLPFFFFREISAIDGSNPSRCCLLRFFARKVGVCLRVVAYDCVVAKERRRRRRRQNCLKTDLIVWQMLSFSLSASDFNNHLSYFEKRRACRCRAKFFSLSEHFFSWVAPRLYVLCRKVVSL